jgi:hypothetical protein
MKSEKTEASPSRSRRNLIRGVVGFVATSLTAGIVEALSWKKRRGKSSKPGAKKKGKRSRRVKARRYLNTGPISGDQLYRDLIAYYNLGEHRTASDADLKTSDWILQELRSAGAAATFQRFTLRQFLSKVSSITAPGISVRAFPLWPPRATGATPFRAKLVRFIPDSAAPAVSGQIALVRFPFDASSSVGTGHQQIIGNAIKAGAAAVVAVTEGPTGEIIAFNVEPETAPWPVPVVLVAQRDEPILMSRVTGGGEISLLVDGRDEPDAEARNVIGRTARGEKLIVVSTPQSGWFRCAAERGPGIALFLGLARWAVKRASGASFLFVSTSGHELGGLGMRAFLKDLAPKPDRVLCWLHLGAGIASFAWEDTANGPRRLREADPRRLMMISKGLEPVISESFAGLSGLNTPSSRLVGEFELIAKAGYRGFGMAAAHKFHHTPADSPEMTGPELLEPVASALVKALESIESS